METGNVTYDIKDILLKHISENPGIRYRELLRLADLANGVLTHHLVALEKTDCIKVDRKKKVTRYYLPNVSAKESDIIGNLRSNTSKKIILFMIKHDLCTFKEIVEHTQKAPSTISWHLKRLGDSGIVTTQNGECIHYKLTDREAVIETLYKYKESFTDKIVNNYIDMIESL